jgi:ABC-type branched-subunit amino acid transport system permease subunit
MVGMYYRQISFTMGWNYGLKAFTATILGGIGNLPGAMLGGLLLGTLEMLGGAYISSAWKDVFVFLILILVLIFRPTAFWVKKSPKKSDTMNAYLKKWRNTLGRQSVGLSLVLILFALYPFLMSDYFIDVAFFFGIYALLGLSLNVVLGEVGLFDLGHAGFYAIGLIPLLFSIPH